MFLFSSIAEAAFGGQRHPQLALRWMLQLYRVSRRRFDYKDHNPFCYASRACTQATTALNQAVRFVIVRAVSRKCMRS